MWNYFVKGGFMMWPLLCCSIFSVAIIINRLIFFRKVRTDHKKVEKFLDFVEKKELQKALQIAQSSNSAVVNVLKNGLTKFHEGKESIEKALDEASLYEIPELEKYLPFLSAIASTSTLIGFTGTVTGMIRAFNDIVKHGVSTPTVVAKGIAEALITTAAGLFIAIPTILFYHYFSHQVERITTEIELYSRELLKLK